MQKVYPDGVQTVLGVLSRLRKNHLGHENRVRMLQRWGRLLTPDERKSRRTCKLERLGQGGRQEGRPQAGSGWDNAAAPSPFPGPVRRLEVERKYMQQQLSQQVLPEFEETALFPNSETTGHPRQAVTQSLPVHVLQKDFVGYLKHF